MFFFQSVGIVQVTQKNWSCAKTIVMGGKDNVTCTKRKICREYQATSHNHKDFEKIALKSEISN